MKTRPAKANNRFNWAAVLPAVTVRIRRRFKQHWLGTPRENANWQNKFVEK